MTDIEDLKPCKKHPCVASYGPSTIKDITTPKYWCACGLSKNQPWCDGSHIGTSFQPLKWTPPTEKQSIYSICNCKYTSKAPYCDGSHISLPLEYLKGIEQCAADHGKVGKLCEECGWKK